MKSGTIFEIRTSLLVFCCWVNAPSFAQETAADLVKMLVSPNQPLRFGGKYDLWDIPTKAPRYDLKAQDQVNSAWQRLVQMGPGAFTELIGSIDDNRYCTSANRYSVCADFSVGQICDKILRSQLEFYSRLDQYNGGRDKADPSFMLALLSDREKARQWGESHRKTPLWKIQIEVLEWVMANAETGSRSIYSEATARGQAFYLIDHLRRTQEPLSPEDAYFHNVPGSHVLHRRIPGNSDNETEKESPFVREPKK